MTAEVTTLQNKVDAMNRLVQVSLVMNSTLSLEPLLQYIMQSAAEITSAETASILLMDEKTRQLRFEATTDPNASGLHGMPIPLEGSIAGRIINENRAIIIDDAASDPQHFREVDEALDFQTHSILGVPMRIKDKLVGVLEVINKTEGRFNESDVRHITILASQAAVAVENAQLVSALRAANEELEQVNKLKSDFIAIASHELRTPLGVVLGYASFLKEESEGTASDHADRVIQSAMHLSTIIEDMTNLRYVQLKESELDRANIQVAEVLTQAHSDTIKLAETKEQGLVYEPPQQLMPIFADRELLGMAITNVLNNAVKFTPQGGVIVVSAAVYENEVRITVKDNGIGIAASHLDKVFQQFYQVEDHLTRRHNGLGLGLSIAKAIIERHGGRIWAESPGPDMGTTFFIAIPLAAEKTT